MDLLLHLFLWKFFFRLLPASDVFSIKLPLKCDSPIKNNSRLDKNCIFRRESFETGLYTKGKLPPFPISATKRTNDIGQFSDMDFNKIVERDKILPSIISIGDSFVESIQVKNEQSFHDILNKYNDDNGNQIFSTAFGFGGNALSHYLVTTIFVESFLADHNIIYVYPIISNDFDESIKGYKSKVYGGIFDLQQKFGNKLMFNNFLDSYKMRIKRLIFSVSAISRYLSSNLELSKLVYKKPICHIAKIPCSSLNLYKENIRESTKEDDLKRYKDSNIATDIF